MDPRHKGGGVSVYGTQKYTPPGLSRGSILAPGSIADE